MLLNQKIEFWGVKGVHHLELELSDKRMNVLIGANGIGKTKALESLFTLLLFSNQYIAKNFYAYKKHLVFDECKINDGSVCKNIFQSDNFGEKIEKIIDSTLRHNLPVVYIAAQNRGEIGVLGTDKISPLGEYEERRKRYFETVLNGMGDKFSSLNMNTPIEEWFIQRAMSANDYQDDKDNREVELLTVLRILHKIDPRISAEKRDFKVIGSKYVALSIAGESRRLNELSSGFASLIKIVQTIVAGYSFFTNTRKIEQVQGYVLIDEIESHLHVEWQTRILPLLIDVFPNTYFVITTHSSLVLAQLAQGEAFQLVKRDGKVETKVIPNPSQSALIDLLEEAFNVNLNKLKLDSTTPESQLEAKKALLALLEG
ncbi:AAA family ATPase [Ursidibacter arcticus]